MQINIFSYKFPAPIGNIGIAESGGKIIRVIFNAAMGDIKNDEFLHKCFNKPQYAGYTPVAQASEYTDGAASQFDMYLEGRKAAFDLLYSYGDCGFAGKVYNELLNIPAGQVRSYREIAEVCGSPKACRAVGMVNRNNPIPFFIPCHRVIGSDGSLTGYAGGLPMKRYLLDLEKKYYAKTAV